ncbi:cell division regulator GpsB [Companilactobacillus crustorum]|nr:cell division regulator GpsB [Companilactobacillus crustorum]WDT66588.1 cell division regulator GpsB [Companilactobacillus crustorum]
MNNMNGMNQQQSNGNGNNDLSLNYQPNDILQKEFKTKMRGYDPTEVDQFLDGIIKDYETFNNEIGQLKSENERLMQARNAGAGNTSQNFQQPRQQSNRMRPQAKTSTSATAETSTNYDILRRISNLEKRVFGHDFANGLPENNDSKQFASAVVPNNMSNNHGGVESGHTEINPGMNQQRPMNNNGFNNTNNNFQQNRPMNNGANQNQNNFNGNLNNSNNYNQF